MGRFARRMGLIVAVSAFTGIYLTALLAAGWHPRTSTQVFVAVIVSMGAAVVTLAGIAAARERLRGRSAGWPVFVACLAALAAAICALLALTGMPVETRGERATVYWTGLLAALAVLGLGWLVVRRR